MEATTAEGSATRRSWPTIVGYFAVLLAFEVAMRSTTFSTLVPESLPARLARKASWLASRPRPDVLLVGDSTMHRGVEVRAFEEGHGGGTVLNAAFTSGTPIVMRAMTAELPWTAPTIVYGMSPLILSDSWNSEPHEQEVATFKERAALLGFPTAVLSASSIYRRRRTFVAAVRSWGAPLVAAERDDELGSLAIESDEGPSDANATLIWNGWRPQARAIGVRARALAPLAEHWRDAGSRVVYVLMPVTRRIRELSAGIAEGFTRQALAPILRAYGGVIVDCTDALPDAAFYDADHLRAGPLRDAFSRRLGAIIASGKSDCTGP